MSAQPFFFFLFSVLATISPTRRPTHILSNLLDMDKEIRGHSCFVKLDIIFPQRSTWQDHHCQRSRYIEEHIHRSCFQLARATIVNVLDIQRNIYIKVVFSQPATRQLPFDSSLFFSNKAIFYDLELQPRDLYL